MKLESQVKPDRAEAVDAERVEEICTLLANAGAGALRPVRADREGLGGPDGIDDRVPLLDGWALSGGADESTRRAAAEVIRALYRAEEELGSLSNEILVRYEEATLIYRLSQRIGEVLGESAVVKLVIRNATELLGARAGEIWLRDGDAVRLGAAEPELPGACWDRDDPLPCEALRRNTIRTREAGSGETLAAVPLPGPDQDAIGVLVLRGRSGGRSYRSGEVKLLQTLASITSAFVRNDRLAATARRAEARRREDEIAREIHRSLLPASDPDVPGLEIRGGCRAAESVGGDYYGYVTLPDDSLLVALADASGHGVGAGLYMAATKGALRGHAGWVSSPADLLRRTNESLNDDLVQSGMFATAFVARFLPGGRRLEYSNAGHNPPLLVRADGSVRLLDRGGAALGMTPGVTYEEDRLDLDEGDLLIAYTDGLTEARDEDRHFYTLDRLIRLAREQRAAAAGRVRDEILADLARHTGDRAPQDDVTLLVVRVSGARGARGARRA